jgi:hypothetical protein
MLFQINTRSTQFFFLTSYLVINSADVKAADKMAKLFDEKKDVKRKSH